MRGRTCWQFSGRNVGIGSTSATSIPIGYNIIEDVFQAPYLSHDSSTCSHVLSHCSSCSWYSCYLSGGMTMAQTPSATLRAVQKQRQKPMIACPRHQHPSPSPSQDSVHPIAQEQFEQPARPAHPRESHNHASSVQTQTGWAQKRK